MEFRDERWLNEAIYDVLHRHGAALCIHDMIENHPAVLTTDWTYLRFHGKNGGNYARNDLAASARRIGKHLDRGLDVYVFFNNDAEGFAVTNALDLKGLVENGMTGA